MKPRIRWIVYMNGCNGFIRVWECSDKSRIGMGSTPQRAYENWAEQKDRR